jgi:glycosyltransferase involved in cell wall biosynthesis
MKIAFIVQRYGPEVLGGSEHLCRLVAERLAPRHDIDVFTTCARDYVTWRNEYPEGADRVKGVTIRRFPTDRTRDLAAFNRFSDWIFSSPHTREDEVEWLRRQGPWSPSLIEHLRRHQQQYDALVFFTYLYAPTVVGLEVQPGRSVLVPTAHDEPAIRLEIFKDVFRRAGAIGYLTDSERRFVQERFPERPLLEDVVGVGVDLPHTDHEPGVSTDEGGADEPADSPSTDAHSDGNRLPPHLSARGASFRRRHRLFGPLVLYGGRIDPGKGCEELIEYFRAYAKEGGEATLALMGAKLMALPDEPFIRFAGLLSDRERTEALEAATVVVCPSPYESLSLLALESMAAGTPILANARSSVLVDHCVESNGGLYYADGDEFVECLKALVADASLRSALGRNGRAYVGQRYRWEVVLERYERLITSVAGAK